MVSVNIYIPFDWLHSQEKYMEEHGSQAYGSYMAECMENIGNQGCEEMSNRIVC